jgi:REP element-mobilizing transposase RayT
LRELIERKRQWNSPPEREHAKLGFGGWHERGYLPHRDEPGLIQFVTFRLVDSFPADVRAEWEHLWKIQNLRERRVELQAYLDRGKGKSYLRDPKIAAVVEEEIRRFHGERYALRAWVVMPNHVHVLFRVGQLPMSRVVGDWKKHSARLANRILQRTGAFWEADFWDTFMRDPEHEATACEYIENNPVKARLVKRVKDWPWSSVRWRDEAGRLKI